MASSPPPRQPLPFEPRQNKKKPAAKAAPASSAPAKIPANKTTPAPIAPKTSAKRSRASEQAIPDEVSKRMIKRMALFSGIPTGLAMLSFVAFYWVVSHDLLDVPTYVVFAVSLGLFGLGVLGLSYGIFSTSWDEGRVGHWWGWEDFKINLSRTAKAWRSPKADS